MRKSAGQTRGRIHSVHICIHEASDDVVLVWQQSVRSGRSIVPRLRACEPYFGVGSVEPSGSLLPFSGLRRAQRRLPASTGDCTFPPSVAQLRTSNTAALLLHTRCSSTARPLHVVYLTIRYLATSRSLGVVLPSLSPITLRKQGHFGRP